jgi:hypothetical protein
MFHLSNSETSRSNFSTVGTARALGTSWAGSSNSGLGSDSSSHRESCNYSNSSSATDTGIGRDRSNPKDIDTGFANCRDMCRFEGNATLGHRVPDKD